jgi:hypothetical protein
MACFGKLPFQRMEEDAFAAEAADPTGVSPLPAPPDEWSWRPAIPDGNAPGAWQYLHNDKYPDCTVAGACHMMMSWSANALAGVWTFNEDDALADFERYKTSPDGAYMQNILNKWQSKGIRRREGGTAVSTLIDDWALLNINNKDELITQVKQAIYLFGGCYIGVVLPKFLIQYKSSVPDPEPNDPDNPGWNINLATIQAYGPLSSKDLKAGHCVAAVAYTKDALWVVSWGNCTQMSWDFFCAYMDEAYAVSCPSAWQKPDRQTPSNLDDEQLAADFKSIKLAGKGIAL